MSRPQLSLLFFATLLAVACGGLPPSSVGIGPFEGGDQDARWAQTLSALSELGYAPQATDRQRGLVTVGPRFERSAFFSVRLTRNGWVRLAITDRSGREMAKPWLASALSNELVELSIALRERLGQGPPSEPPPDGADDVGDDGGEEDES